MNFPDFVTTLPPPDDIEARHRYTPVGIAAPLEAVTSQSYVYTLPAQWAVSLFFHTICPSILNTSMVTSSVLPGKLWASTKVDNWPKRAGEGFSSRLAMCGARPGTTTNENSATEELLYKSQARNTAVCSPADRLPSVMPTVPRV